MSKESYIEQTAVKKAKERGWHSQKMDIVDRAFFKAGVTVIVEYKQKGKKPTALQDDELERWRERGFAATWHDDWRDTMVFLDDHDPTLKS